MMTTSIQRSMMTTTKKVFKWSKSVGKSRMEMTKNTTQWVLPCIILPGNLIPNIFGLRTLYFCRPFCFCLLWRQTGQIVNKTLSEFQIAWNVWENLIVEIWSVSEGWSPFPSIAHDTTLVSNALPILGKNWGKWTNREDTHLDGCHFAIAKL